MQPTITKHDPLLFGADDDMDNVMEDLTAQLERGNPLGDGDSSREGSFHFGNHHDLDQGDNPFMSDSQHSPGEAYASYGQLVTPPSYEESVRYDNTGDIGGPLGGPLRGTGAGPSTSAAPLIGVSEGDGEGEEGRRRSDFSPRAPTRDIPPDQLLHISVSDPMKKEQPGMFGMKGSYVVYKITTRTDLPSYGGHDAVTKRRFRDVVSLSDLLKARFRGFFVPSRPEKNAVEAQRMKEDFIEERRSAVEKYLLRLARHPVIAKSEELRLWLSYEGDLSGCMQWAQLMPSAATVMQGTAKLGRQIFGQDRGVVDAISATQPTKKSGDLVRAVKEQIQAGKHTALSPEEINLRRCREVVEEMRECLLNSSRSAERLIHRMDRLGAVRGDLGLSLFKLAKYEETDGAVLAQSTGTMRFSTAITGDCKRTAAALVKVSRTARKVTGRCAMELQALHDYLGFMPCVLRGLTAREAQLLTQQTLEADHEAKRKAIQDLETGTTTVMLGGPAAKVKKIADLNEDASKLDLSIMAARSEYERILDANRSELERFKTDRSQDFLRMLTGFTMVQTASSERSLEIWLQLAQELGATHEQIMEARSSVAPDVPLTSNGA